MRFYMENSAQRKHHGLAPGFGLALVLLMLFAGRAPLLAQQVRVFFPVNQTTLHRDYLSNRQSFARLDSLFANLPRDLDSVIVVSKASPEGPYQNNLRLANGRAKAIFDYLVARYPHFENKIFMDPQGESYPEFRRVVLDDTFISDEARQRLLEVIDADITPEQKKSRLKSIPEYAYFLRRYFPEMRYSAVDIVFKFPYEVFEDIVIADEDYYYPLDPIDLGDDGAFVVDPMRSWRTILALKTNLLYDAVTALNFEVEVPIADRYSLMVEDVFPWWETGNKYCLQMWEMGVEGRYWFRPWNPRGTNKLRGWFAGLYGMSSKYDFQYDRDVNWQGEYWSAGVSGGYSMPLGRKKWGNLEFSIGLGYLNTQFRHYQPTDSYDKLIHDRYRDGQASYVGPTKAKISLVIPINVPNPIKKGGAK